MDRTVEVLEVAHENKAHEDNSPIKIKTCAVPCCRMAANAAGIPDASVEFICTPCSTTVVVGLRAKNSSAMVGKQS